MMAKPVGHSSWAIKNVAARVKGKNETIRGWDFILRRRTFHSADSTRSELAYPA